MATNVAFIVYSLGKNGTTGVSPGTDENWNLNTTGSEQNIREQDLLGCLDYGASFDDQLLWVSSYALISRMVAAGALP